jgi:fibronectin-binding autotransporter adhesin
MERHFATHAVTLDVESKISDLRCAIFPAAMLALFLLTGPLPVAHADFIVSGNVDPTDPSAWTSSTYGYIGKKSYGSLLVNSGSDLLSNYSYIGYSSGVSGAVTVDGSGSTWTNSSILFVSYSGNGQLNITGGGAVSNGGPALIGDSDYSTGVVTVDGTGSTWNNNSDLNVGFYGKGTLNITGCATVYSNTYAYIGYNFGSAGIVTVNGTGSTWNNNSDIYVGYRGSGTLNVTSGSVVAVNRDAFVGYNSGSTGSINFGAAGGTLSVEKTFFGSPSQVTGNGTIIAHGLVSDFALILDTTASLHQSRPFGGSSLDLDLATNPDDNGVLGAGYHGSGSIAIRNGISVKSSGGYIGYGSNSTGVVTVDGSGSTWDNSSNLYVGQSGKGTLNITGGGTVSNSNAYIGNSGSSCIVTVDGTGSTWSNIGDLYVNGTLNITGGGSVSNYRAYIGNQSGSTGVVTVNGTGSSWNYNSDLYVGYSGNGTLNITGGGAVSSSAFAHIGGNSGFTGVVTVDGTGSSWNNNSTLYVGDSGNGTLNITNGSVVAVGGSTLVGRESGFTGVINFGAAGGTLTAKSLFASPNQVTGNGTIIAHGLVSDYDLILDTTASLHQLRPFNGSSLELDLETNPSGNSALGAGYRGNGSLAIRNGITVTSGGGYIGYGSGSTGTATVDGTGSTWTINDGYLHVGNSGNGTLSISGGGTVSNTRYVYIGYNAGSTGVVTVDGTGSALTNSNYDLHVGSSGNGTLNVTNGSVVTVGGNTFVGRESGSTGIINFGAAGGTLTTRALLASPSQVTGNGKIIAHGLVSDLDLVLDTTTSLHQMLPFNGSSLDLDMATNPSDNGPIGAGYRGSGSLAIRNGITVASGGGYIGYGSGSTGVVTVDGAGSTWTGNRSTLSVGSYGNGTLNITGGGSVSGFYTSIGSSSGSTGIATVDGTGSMWNIWDFLYVGRSGNGTLNITGGGFASSSRAYIGYSAGSMGEMTVDGTGSTWNNSMALDIGRSGKGTLNITGGGAVAATSISVNSQSLLAINVGNGSKLTVGSGSGTLSNGGKVRLIASAGPAGGTTFTPILAGTVGGNPYQAIGGTWDSGTREFTASLVQAAMAGDPINIDLHDKQRVMVVDGGSGKVIGASFLAKASSTPLSFTASIINDVSTLNALQILAGSDQTIQGAWNFTTDYLSTDPAYLSFPIPAGFDRYDVHVFRYSSGTWSAYDATDLTCSGPYTSFTVTGFSGYAITTPEPGTLALLLTATLAAMGFARRRK